MNISRTISESAKNEICAKFVANQHFRYFYVFYSLLPIDLGDEDFYRENFVKHLNVIINKNSTKTKLVFEKLIFTYCKLFNDLSFYRDFLYKKYLELYNKDSNLLCYLKNGIILMNSKCSNKLIWLTKDKFINIAINDKLIINCDQFIKLKEVRDSKNKFINFYQQEENCYIIENVGRIFIDLTFYINDEKLDKRIFI